MVSHIDILDRIRVAPFPSSLAKKGDIKYICFISVGESLFQALTPNFSRMIRKALSASLASSSTASSSDTISTRGR